SDQYSLGIILQELLTDRRPLLARSGETPGTDSTSGSSPGSPPSLGRLRRGSLAMYPDNGRFLRDLRAILSRSLDPDPRNRYATIRDLEQDLVCLLEGEAVKARPVGTWEGLRRKWSLYRLPIAGVGLLSLLLAGSLGYTQYKGKQYRTALQQSKVARADAEEHAQVMERFAREILTGLELRLRQVPNAYAIRDMLLSIGTQFFERDRYAKSIPEGLLVTVLDAYRNLALLRMYPMEGGGTRLRDAMEAFGKAYALIPTLEAANPQRGQRYRGLLLLDWGLAETDNLHLESGFQKLRQAQAIFDGAADRSQQPAHPEDALRTLLSIASNRNQAGEAKAAVAALDRLAKVESLLSAERLTDPFLEGTCFMVNLSAANLWWDLGQEDRARTLYTELHQKNWSHPSGNPNQDVISALGYINRLKLDWRMDPKAPTESLLNRLDGVLQGLLRADVEDTHYAEGVAQLYSLRARILNGAGAPRQAAEALEEAFRFWRFCIRADPDNASAKRAMTEDLLLGVDLARNEGASPARIQELREEARAYLEALKHLGVDHPLVAQRIRELDAGR
ncbi:MAG TPA: hypothetical protein P5218_05835, partial [Planctomycetota bacterium]|nr:hypothetical protein [Planctomycetota bacterium]